MRRRRPAALVPARRRDPGNAQVRAAVRRVQKSRHLPRLRGVRDVAPLRRVRRVRGGARRGQTRRHGAAASGLTIRGAPTARPVAARRPTRTVFVDRRPRGDAGGARGVRRRGGGGHRRRRARRRGRGAARDGPDPDERDPDHATRPARRRRALGTRRLHEPRVYRSPSGSFEERRRPSRGGWIAGVALLPDSCSVDNAGVALVPALRKRAPKRKIIS